MVKSLIGMMLLMAIPGCLSVPTFNPPMSVYIVYGGIGACNDIGKCLPIE